MDLLNLVGWRVIAVEETEHDYHIDAEITIAPTECPHCEVEDKFVHNGTKPQTFMDLPIHGKRSGIFVKRKRFLCHNCGKSFLEPLPGIAVGTQMTHRLKAYIEKQSLDETFNKLAASIGIDEKTVRNVFRSYTSDLGKIVKFTTPRVLGIDEVHLVKAMRFVATNNEQGTVIEMLANRDKKSVTKWLSDLPNKENVQIVTMDMWRSYRDAVREQLPAAVIVVDRFHVVKMANTALDTIRKRFREGLTDKQRRQLMHDRYTLLKRRRDLNERDLLILDVWKSNFPELDMAYELKEALFEIWDNTDRETAEKAFEAWKFGIPESQKSEWFELTRAMSHWHTEIFNFFDHRYTNAITEALNGIIKVANRDGRGYSFEAIRAKILYSERHQKNLKPKFDKSRGKPLRYKAVVHGDWGNGRAVHFRDYFESAGVDLSKIEAVVFDEPEDWRTFLETIWVDVLNPTDPNQHGNGESNED